MAKFRSQCYIYDDRNRSKLPSHLSDNSRSTSVQSHHYCALWTCLAKISVFLRSTLRWRRDEGTLRVWVFANSVRTSIGVVYCGYVIINHYFLPLIIINIVFQISWILLLLLGKMRRLLAVLEVLELQSLVNGSTKKSRIALILTRQVSNLVIRLWHFSLI